MSKEEIYFPRTVPVAFLRPLKFTWQKDVDGGATPISNLNIKQDTFMGGNVITLGWMNKYGLYACPEMESLNITALYVHDPSRLTELGRELVRSAFPNGECMFGESKETELSPKLVTPESAAELKELIRPHKPAVVVNPNAILAGRMQPVRSKNNHR